MKRGLFIFLLAATALLGTGIVFAQELEIQYPVLPNGVRLTLQPTLPEFILYLYYFFLATSGFIAIGSLILGGIQYITSGGNVALQTKARQRVSGAVLGILILMGSSLILGTINPNLRILQFTKPASPIKQCDCSNPTEEICKKICEPVQERKKIGAELLEVPVGNLIERITNEKTLAQFAEIAKQAEKLSFEAKETARKYKEELDQCKCSRNTVIPHCSSAPECSPLQCTGEPCDQAALDKKKAALNQALAALTSYIETNIGTNISLTSGMPPGAGGTPVAGGSCAPGTEACSPSSLSAFGSKAGEASQICQKESGGRVLALNNGCLRSNWDYSVGLFQINLYRTGRCPGAFREINTATCEVIDHDILEACMEKYGFGNAEKNIQGALGISSNGNNWCPWTTAFPPPKGCGLCEK